MRKLHPRRIVCGLGLVIGLGAAASCSEFSPREPSLDAATPVDGSVPIDAGAPVEAGDCRPYHVIAALQAKFPYQGPNGTVDPVCSIDPTGAVTMTFQPLACGSFGWWAGCQFAANIDLSAFDAKTGPGEGVIAMTVCVENLVASSLDLRYGSPQLSNQDRTKFVPAIRAEERFTGTGCRLAYLAPSDACYLAGRCGANSGCAPGTPDTCDTFSRSRLTIMNEFCLPSGAAPNGPSTVTVEQVTYYPQNCLCHDTSDCKSPNVCRRDGWPPGATCSMTPGADCPGVCAP